MAILRQQRVTEKLVAASAARAPDGQQVFPDASMAEGVATSATAGLRTEPMQECDCYAAKDAADGVPDPMAKALERVPFGSVEKVEITRVFGFPVFRKMVLQPTCLKLPFKSIPFSSITTVVRSGADLCISYKFDLQTCWIHHKLKFCMASRGTAASWEKVIVAAARQLHIKVTAAIPPQKEGNASAPAAKGLAAFGAGRLEDYEMFSFDESRPFPGASAPIV